jgi:hypothetical protein
MKMLSVLAIVLTALSMGAGIAHVLEMRPKLAMSAEQYRETQQLYRGWAFIGIVLLGALAASADLAIRLRGSAAFSLAAGGVVAIALSLMVFFAFTFPVNRTTRNWTVLPTNWEHLRRQWEYSHAAGTACLFIALLLLSGSAVAAC